jgi:hypothetical protein
MQIVRQFVEVLKYKITDVLILVFWVVMQCGLEGRD